MFLKQIKPNIVLLNETKLNPIHKIEFPNYTFIRNDRDTNRGYQNQHKCLHQAGGIFSYADTTTN